MGVVFVAARIVALCFDSGRPETAGRFWGAMLGRDVVAEPGGVWLAPRAETGFRLRFVGGDHVKREQNRMHFDLTSATPEEQRATVDRALGLGARHADVGQTGEEGHVVLADPEGNEFCVIEAGNKFLAGTGFVGAVSSEGSRAVGYFWSEALGWPLVWDQDEETAVQAPRGGSKITWGGPPLTPPNGKRRLHYDVEVDSRTDVDRLLELGATRRDGLDMGHGDDGALVLADPDGNEFCVVIAQA